MVTFNNTFQTLPSYFYENVFPTPLTKPKVIHVSSLRDNLCLPKNDQHLCAWLNGTERLQGDQRISTRYAGHQFGQWAGQLGDGRAISLGEIETTHGRLEVQTKGSGLTPFSRMGDGKAVIRSSVREYLCSEAMAGLQIPTTRVLALITGEDAVYRETVERSALVARVFPTNVRFGHFEMAFHFNKKKELDALINYVQQQFYQDLSLEEMLLEIVKKTAMMIASWQNVGFCHGVMNTDNMSILGLTIDYGPFGFLEDTNLNHVCNHSDYQGRYAYNEQPSIGMWNLERLLICFMKHVPKERLQEILSTYPDSFEREYLRLSRIKLGLLMEEKSDYQLLVNSLQILARLNIDYTFFWRELSSFEPGREASMNKIWNYYGKRSELVDWLSSYSERLARENSNNQERSERMLRANPKFILRNYIAQEVIENVEGGNSQPLNDWLGILSAPFDEHPAFERYALPTPPEKKNFQVSCSS